MKTHIAALALLATLSACGDVGIIDPESGRVAAGGTTTTPSISLTGTWTRAVVFIDDFGFLHSTQTTWTFNNDGTAVRSLVTRNVSLGLADVIFSTARYRLRGTTLIIEFVTPTSGTSELDVRLQGNSLFLGGQEFTRGF